MDIGFETIGNAILICHDRSPILATDPWVEGDAYFGSWTFSHAIPPEQLEAIKKCRYVWVSHGHPDHLSSRSIKSLGAKTVLLPDHVGGRIRNSLKEQGFDVQVLPDRKWVPLSERIRVLSISDYNQDGILLVDVNGRLVANLNDASDRGWAGFVRNVICNWPSDKTFLLKLSGFGDADMINFFDESGRRVAPRAALKEPVGRQIARMAREFGVRYFVPFSSMHLFQRSDVLWAEEYTTRLSDYAREFESSTCELLPAFIRYDCALDRWEKINPPENKRVVHDPKDFGDDWSETLSRADADKISRYIKAIGHLSEHLDFINMRVGGQDHVIELARRRFERGITFEAPRHSLMIAVEEEIFDDMLIGNFMKTTLHGRFPQTGLYPDFTPYVAKYADNGRAFTQEELDRYFAEYRRRAPLDFLRHQIERKSIETARNLFSMNGAVYRLAKGAYHLVKEI